MIIDYGLTLLNRHGLGLFHKLPDVISILVLECEEVLTNSLVLVIAAKRDLDIGEVPLQGYGLEEEEDLLHHVFLQAVAQFNENLGALRKVKGLAIVVLK